MLKKLKIEVREHDSKTVFIDLDGDFDIYNTVEIKNQVNDLISRDFTNIVFNFKNVGYIDSSGIGATMVILSQMKKAGGRFILMNVFDSVKRVFEITKMTTFFEIINSEEEVLVQLYGRD